MTDSTATERNARRKPTSPYLLPLCLTAAGLLARLAWALALFLNADEALHYLLSTQPTLDLTYKATLTTVHPPLLIVLLHYWSWLGTSEFVLRLPSVLAGTAFCWLMYLWLEKVTDRETALVGLSLLLFCPALIYVSAEIRQYALLMFFLASSLYAIERAVQDDRAGWMLLSFVALLLGISTHYSSLIFALATGVYALLRFLTTSTRPAVIATWIAGEAAALALIAFYVTTHVLPLQRTGFPQSLADSYLRGSIFHRGEDRLIPFIFRANLKVFHYLFSQGAVGVAGLLLFLFGIIVLFRGKDQPLDPRRPTPRQLGWLLILPFVVNCATAIAGSYPYGGTRHNSYLAGFAMAGVAVAIARWRASPVWVKPATLIVGLAICNFTVLPGGVYMKPRDQRIGLMRDAMAFVSHSIPAGSVIVTDLEGRLALDYYLCHNFTVLHPPFSPFLRQDCGKYQMMFQDPRQWIFRAPTFARDMQTLQKMYELEPGMKVWFFQAGFVVDKEPELRALLRKQYGCLAPHQFGANIFACEITLSPTNR
jgi:4-amino-4-deoxy-L-arabinose transferase-like glycosyltransferase